MFNVSLASFAIYFTSRGKCFLLLFFSFSFQFILVVFAYIRSIGAFVFHFGYVLFICKVYTLCRIEIYYIYLKTRNTCWNKPFTTYQHSRARQAPAKKIKKGKTECTKITRGKISRCKKKRNSTNVSNVPNSPPHRRYI